MLLCHCVDGCSTRPLPERVKAIRQFPQPTTVWQFREFIGLMNLYRRIVPHFASTLMPLDALLAQLLNKAAVLSWTAAPNGAFGSVKHRLGEGWPTYVSEQQCGDVDYG